MVVRGADQCGVPSFHRYPSVRVTKSRMARISLGCLVLKAPTKNFAYCHLWLPVLSLGEPTFTAC